VTGVAGIVNVRPVDAGGAASPHEHHDGSMSVASPAGPAGRPDRSFALVAEKHTGTLGSGRTVDAWTFDGRTRTSRRPGRSSGASTLNASDPKSITP
jgi:hypothetical protein